MTDQNSDSESAKMLWTGGWDSTFQLLRLLFIENRSVEPYYLIDEYRQSTGVELLTMKLIRDKIKEVDESVSRLIRPTKYYSVSQIPSNSEITGAYFSVRNSSFLGEQYDWLARFCEDRGMTGLQLCIHEDDKAAVVVAPMIDKEQQPKNAHARVGDQYSGTNEHMLFKYFDFPILDLTKIDMRNIAKGHGWSQIMEMTWFCHSPRNRKPCGRCNPCKYTMEEGMGYRIPVQRRFIGISRVLLKKMLGLRRNGSLSDNT